MALGKTEDDWTADAEQRKLRAALESAGHRYTGQRAAVFQALAGRCDHPTADEIFTSVRRQIPDISLATVYKALEALVSCRLAMKLSCDDGPARYDRRTDSHDHLRCLSCGSVTDVEDSGIGAWLASHDMAAGYDLQGYQLVLLGTCPNCRN